MKTQKREGDFLMPLKAKTDHLKTESEDDWTAIHGRLWLCFTKMEIFCKGKKGLSRDLNQEIGSCASR